MNQHGQIAREKKRGETGDGAGKNNHQETGHERHGQNFQEQEIAHQFHVPNDGQKPKESPMDPRQKKEPQNAKAAALIRSPADPRVNQFLNLRT
jgi:hypothetical protein